MKKIISIFLTFTLVLSLFACSKPTTTANVKETTVNAVSQTQSPAPVQTAPAQIQNTGDPIKDEASWPIGKFGYHEPPEELRKDAINPVTKKPYKDFYSIHLHSDKYGDLTLNYSNNGQRTLFEGNDGTDPTKQLIIIGKDNPISIEQALEDLRIGDSITDNFGK